MAAAVTSTYVVEGMSCEHCRSAVRDEVSAVPGVEAVEVDLASGRLTVCGADVDDDAIRAAVVEAGYDLAPSA